MKLSDLLFLLLLPLSSLQAQEPEIDLLIDTSRLMSQGARCSPEQAPEVGLTEPVGGYAESWLHILQDALLGDRKVSVCMEHEIPAAIDPGRLALDRIHNRPWCCQAPLCEVCAPDHGDPQGPWDPLAGWGRDPDGLEARFGVLSLDARPRPVNDLAGGWSQGEDKLYNEGESIAADRMSEVLAGEDGVRPPTQPNMGLRSEQDAFGGSYWAGQENVQEPNIQNIEAERRIAMLLPDGPRAPLAAALRDAIEHYEVQGAGCQSRFLVLITRGDEGHGYTTNVNEALCNERGEIWSDDTCHGSFPYRSAQKYAQQLKQLGIPLFVIGLSPIYEERLRDLARRGSPGLGFSGSEGYFRADDEASLQKALKHILDLSKGSHRSHTRALVLIPGPGDFEEQDDIRQWRFLAKSQIEDRDYGRLEQIRMGCDPNRIDPERPGALVPFASRLLEELLASEPIRRVLGFHVSTQKVFALLGGENSAFNSLGVPTGEIADLPLRGILGLLAGPLEIVGRFLAGYFGDAGLPGGVMPPEADLQRQLGALTEGQMVAMRPPSLGLQLPAYLNFEKLHAERPTVVILGADDGMLHFFHAVTGRELFSYSPSGPLSRIGSGVLGARAYAGMDLAEMALCRRVSGVGDEECPKSVDDVQFATLLVGNMEDQLFGLDLSFNGMEIEELLEQPIEQRNYFPEGAAWDLPNLGKSRSTPQLSHVQVGKDIHAAAILGCPKDINHNNGRCVLILKARNGEKLGDVRLEGVEEGSVEMDEVMVGTPALFPSGGIGAAERAYIGDNLGRIWRIDLRSNDPAEWKASLAWPPKDAAEKMEPSYTLGRQLLWRPSIALKEDGSLVVVFATGKDVFEPEPGKDPAPIVDSAVVSFTDRRFVNADGSVEFRAQGNWVFPLGEGEVVTGPPVIKNGIVLFTSKRDSAAACASAESRLFGVHYYKVKHTQEGAVMDIARNGRTIHIEPALPLAGGQRALSLLLPPGRVAYGLSVVTSPSCNDEGQPTTEVILNLSDEQSGNSGALSSKEMFVERLGANGLEAVRLDGLLFVNSNTTDLAVCLGCDAKGNPSQSGKHRSTAPFPSILTYWGSTFTD